MASLSAWSCTNCSDGEAFASSLRDEMGKFDRDLASTERQLAAAGGDHVGRGCAAANGWSFEADLAAEPLSS